MASDRQEHTVPTLSGSAFPGTFDHQSLVDENEKLRAQLQRFRALVDIAPAFFAFLDLEGRVTEINELSLRVGRASRENIIGRLVWEGPWFQGIPESAEKTRDLVFRAARGECARSTFQIADASASADARRWVKVEVTHFIGTEKTTDRIAITGIDITEQIAAIEALATERERLRRSEERLSQATRAARLGFYEWDPRTDLMSITDQMRERLGNARQCPSWIGNEFRPSGRPTPGSGSHRRINPLSLRLSRRLPAPASRWTNSVDRGARKGAVRSNGEFNPLLRNLARRYEA